MTKTSGNVNEPNAEQPSLCVHVLKDKCCLLLQLLFFQISVLDQVDIIEVDPDTKEMLKSLVSILSKSDFREIK